MIQVLNWPGNFLHAKIFIVYWWCFFFVQCFSHKHSVYKRLDNNKEETDKDGCIKRKEEKTMVRDELSHQYSVLHERFISLYLTAGFTCWSVVGIIISHRQTSSLYLYPWFIHSRNVDIHFSPTYDKSQTTFSSKTHTQWSLASWHTVHYYKNSPRTYYILQEYNWKG